MSTPANLHAQINSVRRVPKREVYRRLAGYFKRTELTRRSANERLWAHSRAGDDDGVIETLADVQILRLLYSDLGESEVLSHWARLRSDGVDVADIYRQSLAEYRRHADTADRIEACAALGSVLESLNVWAAAGENYDQMLEEARAGGNESAAARALLLLGRLCQHQNDHERASVYLEQARAEFDRLSDRKGVADALGSLGTVFSFRGEHERALQCYNVWLRISTDLRDRASMARASGNIGIVHASRDQFEEAMEHFNTQLRLSRALGDRRGEARALSNMGNVHATLWECEQALECYGMNLRICQELGERQGEARAHGNIGGVYPKLGQPERALESYKAQEAISLELGSLHALALARGNMAMIERGLGQFERALQHFEAAAETHRQNGYRYGLVYWLDGLARTLFEIVQTFDAAPPFLHGFVPGVDRAPANWRTRTLEMARAHAEECAALCAELHRVKSAFDVHLLLARITFAEGDADRATELLRAMLELEADDEQRAELHYSLWKFGATDVDHRHTALRMYRSLIEASPRTNHEARIAELSATPDLNRPTSDDAATE